MKYKNKIVWITGASSGIGEHLAYCFAKEQAILILSSRNTEKLQKVRKKIQALGADCFVHSMDLSDQDSIKQAFNNVHNKFKNIDILINNGGVSQRSLISETPIEIDRLIMDINYFGTVCLTKLVLPLMLNAHGGQIAVISSVVGKFGFPMRSAYSASKHALQGFFETLRAEYQSKNIKVTIISPGRINTDISINAITEKGEKHGKMDPGQAKGMSVIKCSRKIMKAIMKEKKDVLIGEKEVIMVYIRKFLPWIYYKLASKVSPT